MKKLAEVVVGLFLLKLILLLIAKGFTISLLERFYENNNKL